MQSSDMRYERMNQPPRLPENVWQRAQEPKEGLALLFQNLMLITVDHEKPANIEAPASQNTASFYSTEEYLKAKQALDQAFEEAA